jgi:hypothetical protein
METVCSYKTPGFPRTTDITTQKTVHLHSNLVKTIAPQGHIWNHCLFQAHILSPLSSIFFRVTKYVIGSRLGRQFQWNTPQMEMSSEFHFTLGEITPTTAVYEKVG